jgi:hypothetical protein
MNAPLDEDTFWHTALLPVLQLEFEPYLQDLLFEAEHHLTTKPLQIYLLVIKKKSPLVIDNPLARNFRHFNIIEYKSPAMSLSLDDFYKALVYVFLYKAIEGVDITDITLSIVLTKHPNAVFEHIRDVWNYPVTEWEPGIYSIEGFFLPIQIIENKKLSKEHNAFLRSLNEGLDEETLTWAIQLEREEHTIDISAYVDVIARANEARLKELLMNSPTLERIIEEVGLAARWEARGRREGEAYGRREGEATGKAEEKLEIARKLKARGRLLEEIVEDTGLSQELIEKL